MIAHTGLAAGLLQLAAALLAFDSALLRCARRLRRAPWLLHAQRFAQALDEAIFGERAIAGLAAFVVDDHPDLWSEAIDDALSLHRPEGGRRLEIEPEFDPRV